MKFTITIEEDDGHVSQQEFNTCYWYQAVDKFAGQLKLMNWNFPKEYILLHDFGDNTANHTGIIDED